MNSISESQGNIDNNPDAPLLPNIPIVTNNKGDSIKTPPKRKRKYAKKTSNEGTKELSTVTKRRPRRLNRIKKKDSFEDLTHSETYNERHVLSDKIINPVNIPLFLSMIQQRRNNLISNLPVSSTELFDLLL